MTVARRSAMTNECCLSGVPPSLASETPLPAFRVEATARQARLYALHTVASAFAPFGAAARRGGGSSRTIFGNLPDVCIPKDSSPIYRNRLARFLGMRMSGAPQISFKEHGLSRRIQPCPTRTEYPANGSALPNDALREEEIYGQAARLISTSKLNASLRFHTWPINLVVYQEPSEGFYSLGDLISWRVSRLDAFSVSPFRT